MNHKAANVRLVTLMTSDRATVLEALEGATRKRPGLIDGPLFTVLVKCLGGPAPRVRWEAARAVANVAAEHPRLLGSAVAPLLANTKHEGKVVRWGAAQAVVALVRAGCDEGNLIAKVRKLAKSESDDGTRKVYQKLLDELAR